MARQRRRRRPRRSRRRTRRRSVALRAASYALGILLGLSTLLVLPWRWIPPPTSAFMVREARARDAARIDYRWTPRREIAVSLPLAAIAAEDQKFLDHRGFDFESIARAFDERERRVRGASTISQQVVKNLYLWPGRSLARKGIEAYLTVVLEICWPKARILEVYLNIAEFGPGVFGVGAAAPRYFGRTPGALGDREAALLASVLPDPKSRSAAKPSAFVDERADAIEAEAARLVRIGVRDQLGW